MSWDTVWKGMQDINFNKEPYTFQFYKLLLGNYDFRGKKVLEIGCGTGINTILMGLRGAKITLLDYSRDSLNIVRKNLKKFGVDGELILSDAFDYDYKPEYDLCISEGVIEHFKGRKRQRIVDVHADAVKKGGKAVIIVPNRTCIPYRTGKFISEKLGVWMHGFEAPYSRSELEFRTRKASLEIEKVAGGEFLFSFGWLFAPLWLLTDDVLKKSIEFPAKNGITKINYDNSLANKFGRVLGIVGRKK